LKIGDEKNISDLLRISRLTNQFVFLHLLLPHTWFRYLADGTDQSIFNIENYKDKQVYLEQYKYTTQRIQSLIQNLLNETPDSVIILQSDHGMRYADQPFAKKEDINRESHYILNAVYMPNGDYDGLKDDMENVDTFKILLTKIQSYESSKRAIN
jgi:phosphoglycerol transferase MdoB-like AlkP superfamily enzyme